MKMASQMMVPYSEDTLFMRGFSTRLSNDDIRNFFIRNGGNCSVEFFKQSENHDRLFIALKFDSKDVAKDMISRYDKAEVLGDRIQVSWYKDLRRARNKDGGYGRRGWSPDHHGRMYSGGRYGGYNRGYQGNSGRDRWRPQRSRRYTRSSSRSPGRRYSTRSRSRSESSDRKHRSDSHDSRSASSSREHSRSASYSPPRAPASPNQGHAANDNSPPADSTSKHESRRSRSEKKHSKKASTSKAIEKDSENEEENREVRKESLSKSERKLHKKLRRSRDQTLKESHQKDDQDAGSDSQNEMRSPPKPSGGKMMRSTVVPVEHNATPVVQDPASPEERAYQQTKLRQNVDKTAADLSPDDEEFFIGNHGSEGAVEKERRRVRPKAATLSSMAPAPRRMVSPKQHDGRMYSDEMMEDVEERQRNQSSIKIQSKHRPRDPSSPEELRVVRSGGAPVHPGDVSARRQNLYAEDDLADYPDSPPAVPPPAEKSYLTSKDNRVYERRFDEGSMSGRSVDEGNLRPLPRSIPQPIRPVSSSPYPPQTHERCLSPAMRERSPKHPSRERNPSPLHGRSPSPIPRPNHQRRRRAFVEEGSLERDMEGARRVREPGGLNEEVRVEGKRRRQWDDEVMPKAQEALEERQGDSRRTIPPPTTDRLSVTASSVGSSHRGVASTFNGGMKEAERGALGLPSDKLLLVREKKDDIERTYKQDCETFACVTKMLVSKDLLLEDKLQAALRDNLKDIGQRCIHELRDFIDQLQSPSHVLI